MLETVTIVIALGAYGLLAGALLPGAVAYSILFLRKHGRKARTLLGLVARLLLAFLVLSVMSYLIVTIIKMLGGSGELKSVFESTSYIIGGQIGFWGSVVALIVGIRRSRKARGATHR